MFIIRRENQGGYREFGGLMGNYPFFMLRVKMDGLGKMCVMEVHYQNCFDSQTRKQIWKVARKFLLSWVTWNWNRFRHIPVRMHTWLNGFLNSVHFLLYIRGLFFFDTSIYKSLDATLFSSLHQFVHFLILSHYCFFLHIRSCRLAKRKRESDLQSKLAPVKEFTDEATLFC